MKRQETQTELKTQTPAGNGGGLAASLRELEEIVDRMNARLQASWEREEKQVAELAAMFARYKDAL